MSVTVSSSKAVESRLRKAERANRALDNTGVKVTYYPQVFITHDPGSQGHQFAISVDKLIDEVWIDDRDGSLTDSVARELRCIAKRISRVADIVSKKK